MDELEDGGNSTHTRFTSDPLMTSQSYLTHIDSDSHPFSLPAKSLYLCMLIIDECSINLDFNIRHGIYHVINFFIIFSWGDSRECLG